MIERQDVNEKNVLVIGLARSGVAAAKLLLRHGASVTITDNKEAEELGSLVQEMETLGINVETSGHNPETLKKADLVVVSPGVPLTQPVIEEAKVNNVPIISELELGSWYCKGKIAAITGTNGKTTTVSLLYEIVKESTMPCVLAGNVGVPFCEVAETVPGNGVAVLEVSSFQLESIDTFRPRAAAILNITPDHLDRYEGMQHYVEAKAAIMKNQKHKDVIVLNGEDRYTPLLMNQASGRVLTFSTKRPPEIEGCWIENGEIKYRLFGFGQDVLMLADELLIPGMHNLENALAAIAMALAMAVDTKTIVHVLKRFEGVRHRMESLGRVNGIHYVNDSKATNVDAVSKALDSYHNPIVLILGGRDKQGDFKKLNDLINKHGRAVVAMGEAGSVIKEQLEVSCPIIQVLTMKEAIGKAVELAEPSDVVLLSPGCASFDQYKNFEQRGDDFCQLIKEMKEAAN